MVGRTLEPPTTRMSLMATKADYEIATNYLAMSIVEGAVTRRDAYGLAHMIWLYSEKPDFTERRPQPSRTCVVDALVAALLVNSSATDAFRDEVEAVRLANRETWRRDIEKIHDRMRQRVAEMRAERERVEA
jgi:hypothetical protein